MLSPFHHAALQNSSDFWQGGFDLRMTSGNYGMLGTPAGHFRYHPYRGRALGKTRYFGRTPVGQSQNISDEGHTIITTLNPLHMILPGAVSPSFRNVSPQTEAFEVFSSWQEPTLMTINGEEESETSLKVIAKVEEQASNQAPTAGGSGNEH